MGNGSSKLLEFTHANFLLIVSKEQQLCCQPREVDAVRGA